MQASEIEIVDFIEAIRRGDESGVRQMIRQGVDVNAIDFGGETPLMCAATAGQKDIVELLLVAGANVHYRPDGASILALAEMNGHSEVAELLRNAGASD
jgi:ankyrin repeat protein